MVTALLETISILHTPLRLISQNGQEDFSQFYFHKVDKIASGSSYKTLKLWILFSQNLQKVVSTNGGIL